MKTVIEVEHLRKLYGSLVAVDDVSFQVAEGEIFGLLGLNGAGKTTAVECVQGLRRPDAGRISVLGLDPRTETQDLRRLVGSQLQESALPDRIRVWEALDLFSSFGSRDRGAAADLPSWEPLLEQWGLGPKRRASFGSLSGGQRQRLFVALALVNQPRVVFLDEMTTGLDPAARRVAWDLIRAIRDRGTTVVLVTHFMDEAERLCDRLAIMKAGRIIALDSPQGLIAAHAEQIRVRFGSGELQGGASHGAASDGVAPDGAVSTDSVAANAATAGPGASGSFSWLRDVPHVQEVVHRGGQVEVRGTGPVVPLVASALVERGFVPSDLQVEQPALEDVFLKLVGEAPGGPDEE